MRTAFDPIAAAAMDAARAALPEQVQVGGVTALPRGADPFVGTERPLLLAATRWTFVAPGGVLLGGSPAAMAAVLGFDVPATPTPVAAEDRRADAPPPPKWTDLVAEAARETATNVTQAIAAAITPVADLPPDCSSTQVSVNPDDAAIRAEVGPIPDGVVLILHTDEYEVRLVVVVPGVMVARLGDTSPQAEPEVVPEVDASAEGEEARRQAATQLRGELDRALSAVPLELSIGMGHANVPLAHVLHLAEGEVLELEEAVDAPVDLISGGTAVAHGDLEVSDHGTLVLHVTGVPGHRNRDAPTLVADPLLATIPTNQRDAPGASEPEADGLDSPEADSPEADSPESSVDEPPASDDSEGGDAE